MSSASVCNDLRGFLAQHPAVRARFGQNRLTAGDVVAFIVYQHQADNSCRRQGQELKKRVLDCGREIDGCGSSCVPLAGLHVILRDVASIVVDPSGIVAVWKEIAEPPASVARKRPHAATASASASSDALVPAGGTREEQLLPKPRPSAELQALASLEVTPTSPGPYDMVAQLSRDVATLSLENAALAKSRRYFKAKCAQLRETLLEQQAEHRQVLALVGHRAGNRKVSTLAGFNLALKRNFGHASCQAVVLAVAGDEIAGGLKSKHIVTRFEHKASIAIRVQSREFHELCSKATKDPPDSMVLRDRCRASKAWFTLSAFSYRGDATNDVVKNSKVHLAEVCTFALGKEGLEQSAVCPDDAEQGASVSVAYSRSFCDMNLVSFGTGEETYSIMLKEFDSLGATSWEKAAAECATDAHKLCIFAFALDNGPDNQGATRRVRTALEGHDRVMFATTWCVFHQYHLAIKSMLVVLDKSKWSPPADALPTTYFSGVSSVSNSWRAPGIARKIYLAGAAAFGDVAALQRCKKIPGRVLRERWGSIDSVEDIIDDGGTVLAAAFREVIGPKLNAKPVRAAGPAGADAGVEEDFAERARKWRQNAHELLGSDTFRGMVRISRIAKQPLTRFFYWAQKQRRLMTAKRKEAEENAEAYLGPTLLSQLVVSKAEEVLGQLCRLLEAGALDDENRWGLVWKLVPGNALDAKVLILDLVLTAVASWSLRFGPLANDFPHLFLVALERPPDAECAKRKALAGALLSRCHLCLARGARFGCDISLKLRRLFYDDFTIMASTGKCTWMLFLSLLVLRAAMQAETQEVEGWNSLVQTMCRRSPAMQWPLANSRMNIKLSPRISPSSCASVMPQVGAYMSSTGFAGRFQTCSASDFAGLPLEAESPPACFHEFPEKVVLLSHGLALRAQAKLSNTCRYVYELVSFGSGMGIALGDTVSFVAPWSYRRVLHCFAGSTYMAEGGHEMFELPLQVVPQKLSWLIASAYQGLVDDGTLDPAQKIKSCTLRKHRAIFQPGSLKLAKLELAETIEVEMKAAPCKRKARKPDPGPDALADILLGHAAGDSDGDGEFDIEAELDQLIDDDGEVGAEIDAEGCGLDDFGADLPDDLAEAALHREGADDQIDGDQELPDHDHYLGSASAAELEGIVARLRARRRDAVEAIAAAKRQAVEHNELRPTIGSISLVRHQHDISEDVVQKDILFVQWSNFSERLARVVQLDDNNGIVYNIPFLVPVRHFPEATTEVLISRLPVTMCKVRKAHRMPMVSWALELLAHERAQVVAGSVIGDSCPCIVCELAAEALGSKGVEADRFVCGRCSLRWHAPCSAFISAAVGVEDKCGLGECPMCIAVSDSGP